MLKVPHKLISFGFSRKHQIAALVLKLEQQFGEVLVKLVALVEMVGKILEAIVGSSDHLENLLALVSTRCALFEHGELLACSLNISEQILLAVA